LIVHILVQIKLGWKILEESNYVFLDGIGCLEVEKLDLLSFLDKRVLMNKFITANKVIIQ